LVIGGVTQIQLVNGDRLRGTVLDAEGDWLLLDAAQGRVAIARQSIALLTIDGALPAKRNSGSRRRESPEPTSEAAAEILPPEQLRAVVDGFLDDRPDDDLARTFSCTRSQIRLLRQAFECARGNLVEDQLPPAARSQVDGLRAALGG
jgi:hypothetical protein